MITYPTEAGQEKAALSVKASLQLSGAGKKYPLRGANACGDFWALKDINLEVKEREIVGIIGRNGAGKTSLLNIISGTLSPTEGSVTKNGRVLGLFSLGVGFQDELTGRENIFLNGAILGAGKKELNDKVNSIIEFSELGDFIDMPLGSYSQGMRLRLGFSIVTALDFDILVIDEILAVGDALFQNKCFQRLLDFKRQGRTLIITSQSMDLVERLCDKVALIDHGKLLFFGNPQEGIGKYKLLLNTEKFSVGPANKNVNLVTDTKKWSDSISDWGKKFGTREVQIDCVKFINRLGMATPVIKGGESIKIKFNFTVKNTIRDVHFGVAIFRADGVYCYGPNTSFDNINIAEIRPGKGWFSLEYKRILLRPGKYNISVAIWDRNETLAYAYDNGCYNFYIYGNSGEGDLLNLPVKVLPEAGPFGLFSRLPNFKEAKFPEGDNLSAIKNVSLPGYAATVRLLDSSGIEKRTCFTNESVRFAVLLNERAAVKDNHVLVGILREDGILCQRVVRKVEKCEHVEFLFPKLALLPGGYKLSLGLWNQKSQSFMIYNRDILHFQMVSEHRDHGTVYLEHRWKWSLP